MSFRSVICAGAAMSLLVACGSSGNDVLGPSNSALVQFVNATPSGPVTMANGSSTVGTSLSSNQGSTYCVPVPTGSRTLSFSSGGSTIASAPATDFVAGQRYTVLLQGQGTGQSAIVMPENYTAQTSGNYGLRVINATNAVGNVYVTTSTGSTAGTPTASLAPGTSTVTASGSNFMTFPSSTARVRFFSTTSTTTPLGDFTVSGPNSVTGTTVVFANKTDGGVTAFALNQCIQQ
jgi:uncharacterized protein DUF4397